MRNPALHLLAAAALGFGLTACSDTRDTDSLAGPDMPDAAGDVAENDMPDMPDTTTDTPAADDTAQNADDSGLTASDQSNSERDVELTRMIRQKITENEDFSTDAENVKVIAENGVVTLRGPVETEEEKQAIVDLARETEGVSRVDDQLEVASR